jgi:4-hydroxythreonine-4-phosphate dehydrogenase
MTQARLAVSVGCPSGVGPEVSVVAAAEERGARVLLVGDWGAIAQAACGRKLDPKKKLLRVASPDEAWSVAGRVPVWQPTPDLAERDRKPGTPTAAGGAAQLAWIDAACDLVARGGADALVTGPVSKEAIVRSGAPGSARFLGHTEHLQRRLGAREVVMAFWSPELVTSLATTHLPLARVPRAVTADAVARATYWLAWLLARISRAAPRVAVASLNPHAGEGGLLGREETTSILPGIARARARLKRDRIAAVLEGPIPAETAFRLARAQRWDGVVAMYHDQATIPMKLASFGDAVNVSLGLPIVRTSVDHGTAYDRAGTYTADARGMQTAMVLAEKLAVSAARRGRTPARPSREQRRQARSA